VARQARDVWLAASAEERTAPGWTVERWLGYWLSTRTSIRPTTRLHYTTDVEHYLIPHLGHLCLADIDLGRLRTAFAEIAATTNRKGRPQSASALQHLRTTLRAALNLAVRDGVIATNPARHLEIPAYRQQRAQVWTDGRIAERAIFKPSAWTVGLPYPLVRETRVPATVAPPPRHELPQLLDSIYVRRIFTRLSPDHARFVTGLGLRMATANWATPLKIALEATG
jgi:hypothetical protein